jgi:hypothetical protein
MRILVHVGEVTASQEARRSEGSQGIREFLQEIKRPRDQELGNPYRRSGHQEI